MKMPKTPKLTEEELVKIHMEKLRCTKEEALDIIRTDNLIDNNKPSPYDLSAEQTRTANRITSPKTQNKTSSNSQRGKNKSVDIEKAEIIQEIYDLLCENDFLLLKNIEILNKSRQIGFETATDRYELTLVKKSKPKN